MADREVIGHPEKPQIVSRHTLSYPRVTLEQLPLFTTPLEQRTNSTLVVPILYEHQKSKAFFILKRDTIVETIFRPDYGRKNPFCEGEVNETAVIEDKIKMEEFLNQSQDTEEEEDRAQVLNQIRAFHYFYFKVEEPCYIELQKVGKEQSDISLLVLLRSIVLDS
jgi:hypothetical protein